MANKLISDYKAKPNTVYCLLLLTVLWQQGYYATAILRYFARQTNMPA